MVTAVGRSASVDAGIAPLVEALWRRGIFTENSCEEEPQGMCWVQFSSLRDLESFLEIVLLGVAPERPACGNCFRCRAQGVGTTLFDPPSLNAWTYRIHPSVEPHGLICRIGLWFPKSDYDAVLNLVRLPSS